MYSLDVNFLKDREPITSGPSPGPAPKPKGNRLPMIAGIAAGLLFPALVGAGWFYLRWETGKLQQESAELDGKLQKISAKEKQAEEIKQKIQQANAEANALASVFNLVRPWSAILQDISDRAPAGLQIQTIQQTDINPEEAAKSQQPPAAGQEAADPFATVPKMQLTVSGLALSFNEVNDFLLTLQQSNFLNRQQTLIKDAKLISFPGTLEIPESFQEQSQENEQEPPDIEFPKVVSYTIQTELNNVPASELLQELTRKGAVGLVTRIETLQKQGVIEP